MELSAGWVILLVATIVAVLSEKKMVVSCQVSVFALFLDAFFLVSRHMDNHNLWTPHKFVTKCFKIVMYSVQVSAGL